MKYFIETVTNDVFAFEDDGSQDALITAQMHPMSEEEIAKHLEQPDNSLMENKAEALRRLSATDWVNQPDVYDLMSSQFLINRDVFLAYRSQIRSIAIHPVSGSLNWPEEPKAIWSA